MSGQVQYWIFATGDDLRRLLLNEVTPLLRTQAEDCLRRDPEETDASYAARMKDAAPKTRTAR